MPLESATYISDLVVTNPPGTDNLSTADDHIRLLKSVLKTTFPNITGAVTVTQAALNAIGGAVPASHFPNVNAAVTLTDEELNALANAVLKTIALAKGDILVATGSGAIVRKAVGANNHFLAADSAQSDGLRYANIADAIYAEDLSPDLAADYVMTYDASAGTHKKVKLGNIGGSAASQAEMEAASVTTKYASPGTMKSHPLVSKCWAYVTVSGGTPTLAQAYGISSVTDLGVGLFRMNLVVPFSGTMYAVMATPNNGTDGAVCHFENLQAGSFDIRIQDASGGSARDPVGFSCVAFGDQ